MSIHTYRNAQADRRKQRHKNFTTKQINHGKDGLQLRVMASVQPGGSELYVPYVLWGNTRYSALTISQSLVLCRPLRSRTLTCDWPYGAACTSKNTHTRTDWPYGAALHPKTHTHTHTHTRTDWPYGAACTPKNTHTHKDWLTVRCGLHPKTHTHTRTDWPYGAACTPKHPTHKHWLTVRCGLHPKTHTHTHTRTDWPYGAAYAPKNTHTRTHSDWQIPFLVWHASGMQRGWVHRCVRRVPSRLRRTFLQDGHLPWVGQGESGQLITSLL